MKKLNKKAYERITAIAQPEERLYEMRLTVRFLSKLGFQEAYESVLRETNKIHADRRLPGWVEFDVRDLPKKKPGQPQ